MTDLDWPSRAACIGSPSAWWDPPDRVDLPIGAQSPLYRGRARVICLGNLRDVPECPVRRQCGAEAIALGDRALRAGHALWDKREREQLERWLVATTPEAVG